MEDNIYTPGQETTNSSPLPIPQITLESLRFLDTTAKWTKFLAVVGFISIGIMVIAGFFMVISFSFLDTLPTKTIFPFSFAWVGVIYFILVAVMIYPYIVLNNFSNYTSKAVALRETAYLTIALDNIKKYFKYTGILMIVMIGINIFVVPVIIILAVSASHIML